MDIPKYRYDCGISRYDTAVYHIDILYNYVPSHCRLVFPSALIAVHA